MNYSDLTDYEINMRVALCGSSKILPEVAGDIDVFIVPADEPQIFDPCNCPNDAWPISLEHRINIWPKNTNTDWRASRLTPKQATTCHVDANPLRAAMIVFLMMNEG